ncbi:hypothetical protein CDD80_3028 [Ophiocordyceps camponoti-rufipedis]|uniref:Transcription factor domain-containing protein n=1 Tax=Ophiocordyceps camponoti-rufipedis TaxID=2004952 RepID=A0A2C5XWI1_9HYPO|nr:hypothetical protein CDD80_3028 [Ophiocordyceps camponoti-rufipedis]
MYAETDVFVRISTDDLPLSRWTSVPIDNDTLNHILRLFWTWDMIGNRVIDRAMFERDVKNLDPAKSQRGQLCFCSSFMVNALLALSCHCSTRPRRSFYERGSVCPGGSTTPSTSRRSYFLAVCTRKFVVPLNQRKSIRKPNCPKLWQDESSSIPRQETSDYWWFAYPVSVLPHRSYKREIFAAECALAEIIEDVLDFLIPLDGEEQPKNNPGRALKLYRRLIEWKFSVPDCIRVVSAVVPTAIMLDAYFDDIIITLLRPFDNFSKERFGGIDPKATSLAHASNLMGTIWTFRALYTARNEFWLTHLLAVCAFRVVFDLDSGPIQLDTFLKACQALNELGERFHIARDSLASLQSVLAQHNIRLPAFASRHLRIEAGTCRATVMRHTVVPVSLVKGSESIVGEQPHDTISDIIAMLD